MRVAIAGLLAGFVMAAPPANACASHAWFRLSDLLAADVVVIANIEAFEFDRSKKTTFLKLQTIETLIGFSNSEWQAKWTRWDLSEPRDLGRGSVLVGLRGRIENDGSFSVAVVDKACTATALLSIKDSSGETILTELRQMLGGNP